MDSEKWFCYLSQECYVWFEEGSAWEGATGCMSWVWYWCDSFSEHMLHRDLNDLYAFAWSFCWHSVVRDWEGKGKGISVILYITVFCMYIMNAQLA